MKNFILTTFLLLINLYSFTQISSFTAEIVDGENDCREYLKVTLNNTGTNSNTVAVTVFKYGQIIFSNYYSNTQTVTVAQNSTSELIFEYFIHIIQHRDVIVRVVNIGTNEIINQDVVIPRPPNYNIGKNCGTASVSYVSLIDAEENSISIQMANLPLDLMSEFDTITVLPEVISPFSGLLYSGFNIYTPKQVRVNPTWLAINHLTQVNQLGNPFFHNDSTNSELVPNLLPESGLDHIELAGSDFNLLKLTTKNSETNTIYDNVVYDVIDPLGNTSTFIATGDPQFFLLNTSGSYTLIINEQWLEANAVFSNSPSIVVDFENANFQQFEVYVQCDPLAEQDYYFSYVVANPFVAPLERGSITFSLCNVNCSAQNTSEVNLKLVFPSILTPEMSQISQYYPMICGDTLNLVINIDSDCEILTIPFYLPGTTPIDTDLFFIATIIDSNNTEINIVNNTEYLITNILNSYDPNLKKCNLPLQINPNETEVLTYDIHFQNEGNYMAVKVVIEDTISEHLDLSTFQLIGSKHPVTYSINPANRLIQFTFDNIFLAPKAESEIESQGFVLYSIKEKDNLPINTEINNTAFIYFDFNPAIVTNTTQNINSTLGINLVEENVVKIYPNPSKDILSIHAENFLQVQISDFTGKVFLNSYQQHEIPIGSLAEGAYLVLISTEKGDFLRKLIIK